MRIVSEDFYSWNIISKNEKFTSLFNAVAADFTSMLCNCNNLLVQLMSISTSCQIISPQINSNLSHFDAIDSAVPRVSESLSNWTTSFMAEKIPYNPFFKELMVLIWLSHLVELNDFTVNLQYIHWKRSQRCVDPEKKLLIVLMVERNFTISIAPFTSSMTKFKEWKAHGMKKDC